MYNTKQIEIYFHPGLGKTGSTFLQHNFFPELKGIRYLHKPLPKAAKALQKARHGRYLLSREHDNGIGETIARFAAKFPQVRIILVLRRHDKWIASQYRRLTKNGRGIFFDEFIDIHENQGRWDKGLLDFYGLIRSVEHTTGRPPLVLFHDELQTTPHVFFEKIANFTGCSYDKDKVSLRYVHKAWNDRQLKALRKVARQTFYKRLGKYKKYNSPMERRYRKTLSHLIMYFYWLVPLSRDEKQRPLIAQHLLDEIREAYADDWQKCKAYAQAHPVEKIR